MPPAPSKVRDEQLLVPKPRPRRVAVISDSLGRKLLNRVGCDLECLPLSDIREASPHIISSLLEDKIALFFIVDSLDDQVIRTARKAAAVSSRKDIPAIAVIELQPLGRDVPRTLLARRISKIRKAFDATVLTTIDFYNVVENGLLGARRRVDCCRLVSDLTDLFFDSESKIIDMELRRTWSKNRLILASYGSSNSGFRSVDAARRALQESHGLDYVSCVAKIVGDAELTDKEIDSSLHILREAVGEKRPLIYEVRRDYSLGEGIEVLILLSGLSLSRLPDLRENPLRTIYDLEPESGVDQPLGIELDLPTID